MIGAICESPMTIRSIINWKDAIKDGTAFKRYCRFRSYIRYV